MTAAKPTKSEPDRPALRRVKEWAPVLLLLGLIALSHRGLLGFTPISPLNESREGLIDGQLFVPNQKSTVIIFGLAAFFLVSRLGRLRSSVGVEPATPWSAILFLVGLAIGVWSHYTGELSLSIVSLSLVLLAIAGLMGGASGTRAMRLPALFLLLAIPIPGVLLNSLVYELQLSTAAMNGILLSLLGIENFVSGDLIFTSWAVFHVIEGCSGLRMMETMVMTAIVYQELVPHSRAYSWILVLTAPFLGVFVNQLRVLAIVLNPFAEVSEDHAIQGIVMIIVGTLMIAGFAALLARWLPATTGSARETNSDSASPIPEWPRLRLAVISFLLLASVAATQGGRWEIRRPEHKNPVRLPSQYEGWEAKADRIDEEFFGSTRHTQAILRTYRRGEEEVSVFLAADSRRRPLLSGISPKNESLGPGWHIRRQAPQPLGDGGEIQATISLQEKAGRYAYVIYWQQGTDVYALEALRNAFGVDRSPWQRPYDAIAVRISTPLREYSRDDDRRARERIESLVELVLQNFPDPNSRIPD